MGIHLKVPLIASFEGYKQKCHQRSGLDPTTKAEKSLGYGTGQNYPTGVLKL